ncbi:MAG: 2-oxo acid dehydrogenase subunit E2 [Polyangiaceae bacterium]
MKRERLRGWRRIADAMWHGPDDPQIYGSLDVDATALSAHLAAERAAGHPITVTHLVGRALAIALAEVPEVNVRLVGGYAIPRESVDVFFITSVAAGRELSGVKIANADRKSARDVARELTDRAKRLRAGDDPDLAKSKALLERLPKAMLRVALRVSAFVAGERAHSIPSLGLRASPFGSAIVTSVGMFGLPSGFAPISWMYNVPVLVLVGEITEKPVAIDGAVHVRPIVPICATFDHRYVDGWHVSKLLVAFRSYLAAPSSHERGELPSHAR